MGFYNYDHKVMVLLNSCSFTLINQTTTELTWQGIPVINGIDVALRALRNLMNYRGESQAVCSAAEFDFYATAILSWSSRITAAANLDEVSSLEMMSEFGLPVVASRLVENPQQLQQAGAACSWPVVLKPRRRV